MRGVRGLWSRLESVAASAPGLAAMALLAAWGCSRPADCQRTPAFDLPVDAHGQRVDLAQVDADWAAVADCWRYRGGTHGTRVEVVDDYQIIGGHQVFERDGALWYGLRRGRKVTVTPDLWALKHEFSHIVGPLVGERAENGMGKCYLGG